MNYKIVEKNNIKYIQVPRLEKLGLKHLFTTRDMDMGTTTNLSKESIKYNISEIFNFLEVNPDILYSGRQTHSKNIGLIENKNQGLEYEYGRFFHQTDGLITDKVNIGTLTRFADCSPIILFDANKRVFANIHSGWKGTLERIGAEGVKLLKEKYNSNPRDLIAVIGPTIGKNDFEVDYDVASKFDEEFSYMDNIMLRKKQEKWTIDLQTINKNILLECGLLIENIEIVNLSTVANDFLHSYRRDKSKFGLMASVAILT